MDLQERLKNFLDREGRLTAFPAKRKMKIYALCYLAQKFIPETRYTEREVNSLLRQYTAFNDPATLRRELYDYRFLNREPDGSAYWLEDPQPYIPDNG